eukprot:TRINITY_DN67924_c9_g2_i1.p1 TRINITY_DN67924_c9_g2~~TRINITY_DN67924_c9_g2_i1.p1  ORF type:complete len:548 (+),score=221.74 TRINITY_DN67924_c9_g2_i1:44-1687(+)
MNKNLEVIVSSSPGEGLDVWDLYSAAHIKTIQFEETSSVFCPVATLPASAVKAAQSSQARSGQHEHQQHQQQQRKNHSLMGVASAGSAVSASCHLLVAHKTRAMLEVVNFASAKRKSKSFLREKPTCVVSSNNGHWIAAGGASGQVYVWEAATGQLVRAWSAHYKGVTALRFTLDDAFLVSGAADAIVSVWNMVDVAASPLQESDMFQFAHQQQQQQTAASPASAAAAAGGGGSSGRKLQPLVEWSNHLMPITDIQCTVGGRVFTSSLDRTINIWYIPGRKHMCSLVFPNVINAFCVDAAEQHLLCGAADGSVHRVSLYSHAQPADWTRAVFEGHERDIVSVSLSFDGSRLVTCGADSMVKIWDVYGGQVLKTLAKVRKSYRHAIIVPNVAMFMNATPSQGTATRVFSSTATAFASTAPSAAVASAVANVLNQPFPQLAKHPVPRQELDTHPSATHTPVTVFGGAVDGMVAERAELDDLILFSESPTIASAPSAVPSSSGRRSSKKCKSKADDSGEDSSAALQAAQRRIAELESALQQAIQAIGIHS